MPTKLVTAVVLAGVGANFGVAVSHCGILLNAHADSAGQDGRDSTFLTRCQTKNHICNSRLEGLSFFKVPAMFKFPF